MRPIIRDTAREAERAALDAVADEIRDARRRAEEQDESLPDALRGRFRERRARARAAMSGGVTRAHETVIGARWYARSHPRVTHAFWLAAAIVALSAVAAALTRDSD